MDEQEAEKIKTNVQEAIRQIYARQLPNGGFVYWPGNAVADEWITSYTGMFLTLAQEKGYAVHPNVLNKWKRLPACRRPKLAYAAGSKQLADMAIGIAAGLPPLYPCTGPVHRNTEP